MFVHLSKKRALDANSLAEYAKEDHTNTRTFFSVTLSFTQSAEEASLKIADCVKLRKKNVIVCVWC